MALLQSSKQVDGKMLKKISVNDIAPSPYQTRKEYDEYDLCKLSLSIKENGILQPLCVRPAENGYVLIAGHRRLKAAILAGYTSVPCIVSDADEQSAAVLTVVENLQRKDLTFFEEAEAISFLISKFNLSQSRAAERLGLAQSTLANKLRILKLNSQERQKIISSNLTERHARYLVSIESQEDREKLLNRIISDSLSVAQTEELMKKMAENNGIEPQRTPKRTCAVGDIRLFANSLYKLVNTMKQSGINTDFNKKETAEYTEYTVRIQKQGHPLRLV